MSFSNFTQQLPTTSDKFEGVNPTCSIFEAKQLCWQVGHTKILKELTFSIQQNQFIGVIGPNGAGKSSLLRCLFGKNQISSGSLTFNQKEVSSYSRKSLAQEIAVVLQEPPTHFDMCVFELVSMGLIPRQSLLSFSTQQDRESVQQAIADVGLLEKTQMPFNTLSGGEKQRVMLARAIVQKTKVLILDEPTNHLDIQHQIEVLHLVKAMNITVLLSIHDLNMAAAFCDQIILMDKGEIIQQGDCQTVLNTKNLKQVFKINANIDNHPFHSGQRISYDFSESTKAEKTVNQKMVEQKTVEQKQCKPGVEDD